MLRTSVVHGASAVEFGSTRELLYFVVGTMCGDYIRKYNYRVSDGNFSMEMICADIQLFTSTR